MKSGLQRVIYLLTLMILITSSVGCSTAETTPPSTSSAPPTNLTITLDESASVSALIPQKGGSMSATLANGLVYTLAIPEGALLSDQEVTMTPIRSIDGLPFSGGLIGGVQLEPDGTSLMAPATLTLTIPKGYDQKTLVGFAYHGTGTGFHLTPVNGDGSTVTLSILSFSGHGAASGTNQEASNQAGRSTGSAADDYEQQAADVINGARSRGELNDSEIKKITELWKDYYDKVVKPALQAATSDDSKIDAAVNMFLNWWRQSQLLGLDDDLASRITEGTALTFKGLKNAFDKAYQRCISNQDIQESGNMVKRLYQLELLGGSDSGYTLEGKSKEFERCLRFRVNFESILTATTAMEQEIVSHVAGTVVLKADKANPDPFLQVVRGRGDLVFKEYTSKFGGGSEGMNNVCNITNLTTKDGKLEILGKISWSNMNSAKTQVNIILGIKPSGLEQGFPNFNCDTGMNSIQTNVSVGMDLWSGGFDQLHSDVKGNLQDLSDLYLFSGFEPGSGKLVGRLTQNKTKTVNEGRLEETLTIDVFAAPGAE
jgi:hypothetical protein